LSQTASYDAASNVGICRALVRGGGARGGAQRGQQRRLRGRAVQVDPVKPTLKAPGTERLKLKAEELLSNFGFKFNLRPYVVGAGYLSSTATFGWDGAG
jgi:hypothetical protein